MEHPVMLFEVLGISGRHKLLLPDIAEEIISKGTLTKFSRKAAEAILDCPVDKLTNIRMHLMQDGREVPGSLYAKVIDAVPACGNSFVLRFTSVSPEIEKFFQAQNAGAADPTPAASPSSHGAR